MLTTEEFDILMLLIMPLLSIEGYADNALEAEHS